MYHLQKRSGLWEKQNCRQTEGETDSSFPLNFNTFGGDVSQHIDGVSLGQSTCCGVTVRMEKLGQRLNFSRYFYFLP